MGGNNLRAEAIFSAWKACHCPCTLSHWAASFADWDVLPVVVGGAVVGAVFGKGAEIHVAVMPEHHKEWCRPSMYRWAITDRIKQYGRVVTRGRSDNQFIMRAGFKPIGELNGFTVFERS